MPKKEFKEHLLKFGMLAANVVTATTEGGITNAVEAVAAPPGSSIIKKTTRFSVALQGYVGLPLGFMGKSSSDNPFKKLNSVALYAPLGISLSKGLKSKNMANKASSVRLAFTSRLSISAPL